MQFSRSLILLLEPDATDDEADAVGANIGTALYTAWADSRGLTVDVDSDPPLILVNKGRLPGYWTLSVLKELEVDGGPDAA